MAGRIVDPWHFSHLGKDYFTTILRSAKAAGFWPVTYVYTGKKGVSYNQKEVGRLINPNWMIENAEGQTRTKDSGFRSTGEYTRGNLLRWSYQEIAEFFSLDM